MVQSAPPSSEARDYVAEGEVPAPSSDALTDLGRLVRAWREGPVRDSEARFPAALQAGIDTHDKLLLTSGRISSEMLGKARRMGIPIVASRTAPTSMAVQMAQGWNICVIGYLRRGSLRVYTHPQRLGITP
jgi:hypothetical protein